MTQPVDLKPSSYLSPNPQVSVRKLADGEGAVALMVDSGAYYQLNDLGYRLWDMLGRGATVEGLLAEVTRAMAGPDTLVADAEAFLAHIVKLGLVTVSER